MIIAASGYLSAIAAAVASKLAQHPMTPPPVETPAPEPSAELAALVRKIRQQGTVGTQGPWAYEYDAAKLIAEYTAREVAKALAAKNAP